MKNMRKNKILFAAIAFMLALSFSTMFFSGTNAKAATALWNDWTQMLTYNQAEATNKQNSTTLKTAHVGGYPVGLMVKSTKSGAAANGTGFSIKSAFSGNFELCYGIVPKQSGGTSYADNFAYRKLEFIFTDCADSANTFTYAVHNYNGWGDATKGYAKDMKGASGTGIVSYIEYNGVKRTYEYGVKNPICKGGVNGTEYLYGGLQQGSFIGSEITNTHSGTEDGANTKEGYFKWDSATKQIQVTYPEGWVSTPVADLDDVAYEWGKEFKGFDNYTIAVKFQDVLEGQTPAVILNARSKSNWTGYGEWDGYWFNTVGNQDANKKANIIANTVGNITNFTAGVTKFADGAYPVAAADFEDGYIKSTIGATNVEAKFGIGAEGATENIAIGADTVFPTAGGVYNIYARINDYATQYTDWVKVGEFTVATPVPSIILKSDVLSSIPKGKPYVMPEATVTFNGVTKPVFNVLVTGPTGSKYDNISIKTDLTFTPDILGDFKVKYVGLETYVNSDNITPNPNEKEFTITVKEFSPDVFFGLGDAKIDYAKNGNVNLPKAVKTGNGALISSKTSTTVNFNMIFNDTFDLKYSFLHDKAWAAFNSVKFRFTDAVDTNKYFDYCLQRSTEFSEAKDRTSASVTYKEQTFATKFNDPNEIYTSGKNGSIQAAHFFWEWAEITNQGSLKYSNTTKEVKGNFVDDYVVASFNNEKYAWTNAFAGFTNGYKVSIIMDVFANENGQILIHSINGVDLSGATLSETKGESSIIVTGGNEEVAQNTDYADKGAYGVFGLSGVTTFSLIDSALIGSSIDTSTTGAKTVTYAYAGKTATRTVNVIALPVVTIGGEVGSTYKTGSAVKFPDCSAVFGTQNATTAFKIEITKKGEQAEDITSTKTYTFLAQGEYTLKYYGFNPTSLNDAQKVTNVVEKKMKVYNFNTADIFALNTNTATPCFNGSALTPKVNTGNGLGINFGSEKEVKINAIFSGNFNFNYSFLHSGASDLAKFTVRFTDAKNSENFFDYVLVPGANKDYTIAYVLYNGKQRSTSKDDPNLVVKDDDILLKFDNPKNNYAGCQNSYFYWSWGEVVKQGDLNFELATKSISTSYMEHKYQIASLTDEKYDWGKTFSGFTDGYSVSFIPKFAAEKTSAKLLVHNINGIDFSKELLESFASNDTISLNDSSSVTIDASSSGYIDKGAKYNFNLSGATDVKFSTDITSSSVVDTAVVGEYPVVYNAFGKTATRTVTVADQSAPIISLADGVQDNTNWYYGEAQAVVSAANVTALDFVDGKVENVVISIKKGSGEYAPFTSLNITNDISGTIYTIKYEATDLAGNKSETTRTITVVDLTDPVITVDENAIPKKALIGSEITLPTATATDVGPTTSLDVVVKVMLDGKPVDITNNKFIASSNGTYIITYTAIDDVGNECVIPINVVVSDAYAPIITLNSKNVTDVKCGTEVTLSSASAVDALGGAETAVIAITVKLGTEEITVVNNKFTPSKAGEYSVSYSITDKYSKTTTIINKITVTEVDKPIVKPPADNNKGCNSVMAVDFLLGILGMAFVAIKRR